MFKWSFLILLKMFLLINYKLVLLSQIHYQPSLCYCRSVCRAMMYKCNWYASKLCGDGVSVWISLYSPSLCSTLFYVKNVITNVFFFYQTMCALLSTCIYVHCTLFLCYIWLRLVSTCMCMLLLHNCVVNYLFRCKFKIKCIRQCWV